MHWTKQIRAAAVVVLLAALTIYADPVERWVCDPPTLYENGNPIPASDVLVHTLYCNATPDQSGPPYNVALALECGAIPDMIDMAPVAQGRVGTYYCVATARSTAYDTESDYSNEHAFSVDSTDLGFVPEPPTNLRRA